jgi:CBS domain-containing protein
MPKIVEILKEISRRKKIKSLYKRITEVVNRPVREIMSKNVITISKDDVVINAARLMINNRISSLVVVESKCPVGIITKRELVEKVPIDNKSLYTTKINDIMTSSIITVSHNTTILEANKIMLEKNTKVLLVYKKYKLVGLVTQNDIVKVMNVFGSDIILESRDLDQVRYIMTKDVITLHKGDSVKKAHELMIKNNIGCIIIMEKNLPFGIITEKDFIGHMVKDYEVLNKLRVEQMMSSPVACIHPDLSIFEANKIMLMFESNFKRMPVKIDHKMLGVVTKTDVCRGMYNFISETLGKIKKREIKDIEINKVENES